MENPKKCLTTGSTQWNASLNNIAWSEEPKFRNCNQSEMFDCRCAAATLKYNNGAKYVTNLFKKSLSPRKKPDTYCNQGDKICKYQQSNLINLKRKNKQRIQLKEDRKRKDKTSKLKLGVVYESNILNENSINIQEIPDKMPTMKQIHYMLMSKLLN